jgi:hypothetical protein
MLETPNETLRTWIESWGLRQIQEEEVSGKTDFLKQKARY